MDYDDPPKKYSSITYTINYDKLHQSFIQWTPEKTKELKVMQDQIEDLIERAVELSECKDAKEVIDYIRGLK
jgi:vacuolar-type H+-ATPase catalytic subunit A/Vma1